MTGAEMVWLTVIGVALAGGVLAGQVVVGGARGRVLRRRQRHSVVVTMHSGVAFRGVLFEADGESLVLRDAQALGSNGDGPVPVDGELLLFRHDVEFLQRPGERR